MNVLKISKIPSIPTETPLGFQNLAKQYHSIQTLLAGKTSEQEIKDFLLKQSRSDPSFNQLASGGLIYAILTADSLEESKKHLTHLSLSITDEWYTALCNTNMILLEMFNRLRPQCRERLLFFFGEAIRMKVPRIDNVLPNLLRATSEVSGGGVGSRFKFRFLNFSKVIF